MSKVKEWLKAKKDKVKNSKGFLAIIMLVIGISGTICFYEGRGLYQDYMDTIQYGQKTAIHIINKVEAEEVKEVVKVDPLDGVLDKIQMLESSGGKNDEKCHRIGGHNSYGYAQGSGRNMCLNSDEDVRELVRGWFRDKLKVYSLEQSVCLYNLGLAVDNCQYLTKFKQL